MNDAIKLGNSSTSHIKLGSSYQYLGLIYLECQSYHKQCTASQAITIIDTNAIVSNIDSKYLTICNGN